MISDENNPSVSEEETSSIFMRLSGNLEWIACADADAQLEDGFRMAVHELVRNFRTLGIHMRQASRLRRMMESSSENNDAILSVEEDIARTRYTIERLLRGMSNAASADDLGRYAASLRESAVELSDEDGNVLI